MFGHETFYLFWSTLLASATLLTFVVVFLFCLGTLARMVRRSLRRRRRSISY